MAKPKIKSDGRTITVRVPISIRKRGGRKVVLAPDGTPGTGALFSQRTDSAMVKAIARAFRWRHMLENGTYATVAEIADAEMINASYIARLLRLTLLAPNLVEGILEGRQTGEMTLAHLVRSFPMVWAEQKEELSTRCST
jgi:hypothetical protein